MQITYSHGHVNDLANIKAKEAAIADALSWVRHWIVDHQHNLIPTIDSLRAVEAKLSSAMERV